MGPVSDSIEIDVPRRRAYEELCDLSRRPAFADDLMSDFRLLRIDPRGVGAGARFRFGLPLNRTWADTTIVEAEEPFRIVERGSGGRANRVPNHTVWEVLEGPGPLITVRVSFWTEPGFVDRMVETARGAAFWHERAWGKALQRLRDQLESDPGRRAPVAVAGGNPHATGIP
jgi:hypothetical protein